MKNKSKYKNIVLSLIAGIFVGFLSGFFGGGGGMIVVPLLIYILNLPEKQAHATAIFTILPISLVSSTIYLLNVNINFVNLGFASLGFVAGGVVGALLLKKINNKVLRIIFSLLMIGAGIKIIL